MNFYKFHLGDYYKKANHLSMLEDGAYRRLMDAVYLREGPLPSDKDQIYRLVKAFTKAEKAAVDSVLTEFFIDSGAGYTNARCDEELQSVRIKSAKASQSASTRWSNANAHANAPANAMRTHSDGNASHKPLASSSSTAREAIPVTGHHRVVAADLIDRGKDSLSGWERKFLTDLIGKTEISPKMQATLDAIAAKIGVNLDAVMATWRKRLETARRLQQWDPKWGHMPGQIGCLAPDELLQPGDGKGWTEWRAAS